MQFLEATNVFLVNQAIHQTKFPEQRRQTANLATHVEENEEPKDEP